MFRRIRIGSLLIRQRIQKVVMYIKVTKGMLVVMESRMYEYLIAVAIHNSLMQLWEGADAIHYSFHQTLTDGPNDSCSGRGSQTDRGG